MELLLIRHAAAALRSDDTDDAARPLTAAGAARFRRCARGLRALDVRFDRVLHSPALRAVQTAELLTGLLDGETVVTPHLAEPPNDALYAALDGAACAAAVGHEPWLGQWLARLLVGAQQPAPSIPFKKGAVAWLRGEPRDAGMMLLAMLPPRVLVRLRR